MLYLLDANVLIDANRDYYAIDRVPQFWDWLIEKSELGSVGIIHEIAVELKSVEDDISRWLKDKGLGGKVISQISPDPTIVQDVLDNGYGHDLTSVELQQIGNDPFLISCALADPTNRCVVTVEKSSTSKKRGKRKVPDACRDNGVRAIHSFDFFRELDFRIL